MCPSVFSTLPLLATENSYKFKWCLGYPIIQWISIPLPLLDAIKKSFQMHFILLSNAYEWFVRLCYFLDHINCSNRAIIHLTSDSFCSDKNNGQDRTRLASWVSICQPISDWCFYQDMTNHPCISYNICTFSDLLAYL